MNKIDPSIYPELFNITQEGVWDLDVKSGKIKGSRRYFEIIAYDPNKEISLTDYYKRIHPDDLNPIKSRFERNLVEDNSKREITSHRLIAEDGRIIWVQTVGKNIEFDDSGQATRMIGVARDITAEQVAKNELNNERAKSTHASKLSTLGEMASGIAHEINNPLTIIRGYLKMIEYMVIEKNISREEILDSIKKSQKATERTSKIVASLKYFSRDASLDPFEKKSVSEIIDDTLNFCQARLEKQNVHLEIKYEIEGTDLNCRPVEISQILLNLILNSFDAVRALVPERKWLKVIVSEDKDNIQIRVLDNGEGISDEIRPKLFEPFNTSKPAGEGTGLGLSISKNIARSHFGDLTLESAAHPTTFLLTLPKYK